MNFQYGDVLLGQELADAQGVVSRGIVGVKQIEGRIHRANWHLRRIFPAVQRSMTEKGRDRHYVVLR